MAFFKLRKGGDEAAGSRQPESIEAIRRRARHRLIGAGVLVLVGVLGFPILFDTQPRPISVDIPIEIPDRNKAAPLPEAAPPAPPAATGAAAPTASVAPTPAPVQPAASPVTAGPVTAGPVTAAPAPTSAPAPASNASNASNASTAVAAASPAKAAPETRAPVAPARAAESRPEPKPEPRAPARTDDGARAAALLDGKPPAAAAASTPPAAAEGRFVVQVGAFADVAKAREVRQKLEKAGLKTYTNVAETKDGKRIRVRLGPFTTRADAEKAAEKARRLDLPAALLTL